MNKIFPFKGACYDPALDHDRLANQIGRIYQLMIDGTWYTLSEIAVAIHAPEASISAQLRNLRKPAFGRYIINIRRRGDPEQGLWEYQLLPGIKKKPSGQLEMGV